MKYLLAAGFVLVLLYLAFQFGALGNQYLGDSNRIVNGILSNYRALHGAAPASSAPASNVKEELPQGDSVSAAPAAPIWCAISTATGPVRPPIQCPT